MIRFLQHGGRRSRRGQMIVLFALLLVVLMGMVGLVLDGGGSFAQRRSEQNASDLAALAGANMYLLTHDDTAATSAALAVTSENGYTDGANGTVVTVTIGTDNGATVTVDIDAPHENSFAGLFGMKTWPVGTTATAQTGFPTTAQGAGPMIFSEAAFGTGGEPLAQYSDPDHPYDFGEGNGDVPISPGDLAWTNYGTGNVNTSDVRNIINGSLVINKTLDWGEYIGQHNQGNHTALYSDVDQYLSGSDIPVPIVDNNGNFLGWATFHVVSASGGSSKHVTGYFVSSFVNLQLTVGDCTFDQNCPQYFGSWVLKLIN